MTNPEILEAIRLAIQDECGLTSLQIGRATTAADVPGWDSLAHVRIMMNLEVRLNVDIDIGKTYRAESIGDLADLIAANLPNQQPPVS